MPPPGSAAGIEGTPPAGAAYSGLVCGAPKAPCCGGGSLPLPVPDWKGEAGPPGRSDEVRAGALGASPCSPAAAGGLKKRGGGPAPPPLALLPAGMKVGGRCPSMAGVPAEQGRCTRSWERGRTLPARSRACQRACRISRLAHGYRACRAARAFAPAESACGLPTPAATQTSQAPESAAAIGRCVGSVQSNPLLPGVCADSKGRLGAPCTRLWTLSRRWRRFGMWLDPSAASHT